MDEILSKWKELPVGPRLSVSAREFVPTNPVQQVATKLSFMPTPASTAAMDPTTHAFPMPLSMTSSEFVPMALPGHSPLLAGGSLLVPVQSWNTGSLREFVPGGVWNAETPRYDGFTSSGADSLGSHGSTPLEDDTSGLDSAILGAFHAFGTELEHALPTVRPMMAHDSLSDSEHFRTPDSVYTLNDPRGAYVHPATGGVRDVQVEIKRLLQTLADFSEDERDKLAQLPDTLLEHVIYMLLDQDDTALDDSHSDFSKVPCKYFLQGKCFRSDCWYSHDLATVPCRYFVQGWCRSGSECPFDHDTRVLVSSAIHALRSGDISLDALGSGAEELAVPPDLSTEQFPSLTKATARTAAATAQATVPRAANSSATLSMAAKLKLQQLQASFPSLEEQIVYSHFAANDLSSDKTLSVLRAAYPGAEVKL